MASTTNEPIVQEEGKEQPKPVSKLESIRKPLLWEMIRYSPKNLFVLLSSSKQLQSTLESDASYIQYYLEEMHGYADIRLQNFQGCKQLVASRLRIFPNPQGSYRIQLAIDESKEAGFDRSGWYLSALDDRNGHSTYMSIAKDERKNSPWKIEKTGRKDVYHILDPRNWALSAHRYHGKDKRSGSSTYTMIHTPGWKGKSWKIVPSKGGYYHITLFVDDDQGGPQDVDQTGWYLNAAYQKKSDPNSTFVCIDRDGLECASWKILPIY